MLGLSVVEGRWRTNPKSNQLRVVAAVWPRPMALAVSHEKEAVSRESNRPT